MTTQTIAEEFRGYISGVYDELLHPQQYRECKRAFYAGAWALLTSLMRTLDPQAEVTEADMARLSNIDAELRQFAADVQAGRQ